MISDIISYCWIYFCGIDETETATKCNWELYIDLLLIALALSINNVMIEVSATPAIIVTESGSSTPGDSLSILHGFLEFSILYFSIINSWYLYSHHYTSRFCLSRGGGDATTSKIQSLLTACFIIGMTLSALMCDYSNISSSYHRSSNTNDPTHKISSNEYKSVQLFSLSMIVQRIAVFIMIARVAIYIPLVSPVCAFLGFFIGDSILCYTLSAADISAAPFLWTFVIVMELHIDFFLLVLNNNGREHVNDENGERITRHRSNNQQQYSRASLSYNLKSTMDRVWIIMLAPFGALIVTITTNPDCTNDKLLICSSITLMLLFALLYYDLQHTAYEEVVSRGSELCRVLLLTLIKFLGWGIWTVGSCLVSILVRDGHNRHHLDQNDTAGMPPPILYDSIVGIHLLLGWSVGGSLILFLALRLFGGRRRRGLRRWYRRGSIEATWVMACWAPFLVVLIPSRRTDFTIATYLVIVSALNIIESLINFAELSSTDYTDEEENDHDERQRLLQSTANDSLGVYATA